MGWVMSKDKRSFKREQDGYEVELNIGSWCPTWYIFKDGVLVDNCFKYSPTKCELSGKAQAERALAKLLN